MKNNRKNKVGFVVRRSGDKTAVVRVKRLVKHPIIMKYVTRQKNFHVHDEKNEIDVGDKVKIVECRPISKMKRWRLASIIKKAK